MGARAEKINGIAISDKLTDEVILEAMERRGGLEDPGFCIVCGEEHEQVEPDARNYKCEGCGAMQVFGVEEILMVIAP